MSKEKKAKNKSPLTFDELAWEFERVHEIRDRVNNVTEAVKREEAYARNQRMLGIR